MLLRANSGAEMLLFDNMAVNMNGGKHCRTWWWIIAYTKLVFLILLHQLVFELHTVNFHERGWEMSKTQLRSYGVVAVSKKYQNLKKIGDSYFIAASPNELKNHIFLLLQVGIS